MKSKTRHTSAATALVARAAEFFHGGDASGAEALCRFALAVEPRNLAALRLLGAIALHRQDPAGALERLEAALKSSPRDAFVLIDRARAQAMLGQPDKSLQSLGRAAAAAAENAAALLAAAAGYEGLSALDRAEALYQRVTRLAPDAVEAWIGLGNVYARTNRLAAAETSYRKAEALQPGHPNLLGNLGNLARARGDFAEAEALYRRAVAADPANALAHYNLGQLLFETHRADLAYTCFAEALARQPDFLEPALKLAALTADRGRLSDALDMYVRIEQAHPGCAEARYCRGVTLLALDRPEEAVEYFQGFAQAFPEIESPHSGLGHALLRLRRLAEAELAFRVALQCAPASLDARLDLFDVLVLQGREEEAAALVAQGLIDDPPLWHRTIAATHFQRGRASRALPHYQAAQRLEPEAVETMAVIGEILLMRGEPSPEAWTGATEWIRRARVQARDSTPTTLPDLERLLAAGGGARLLLLTEQGIGDELFFLRFARDAAARGLRLFFHASEKVARLLKPRVFEDFHVYAPDEAPPPADATIRITDLPLLLRHPARGERFPRSLSLNAADARLAQMRARLAQLGPPPYTGVTWRAGTRESRLEWLSRGIRAHTKCVGPALLGAALRDLPGTVLVLQRLPDPDELREFRRGLARTAPDLSDANEDLEAALALLALIDQHVGVSNTNMHLREALGRPSRVLVQCPSEWRWMEVGEESPWFPGTRIYRQAPTGDWNDALAGLRSDLLAALS